MGPGEIPIVGRCIGDVAVEALRRDRVEVRCGDDAECLAKIVDEIRLSGFVSGNGQKLCVVNNG